MCFSGLGFSSLGCEGCRTSAATEVPNVWNPVNLNPKPETLALKDIQAGCMYPAPELFVSLRALKLGKPRTVEPSSPKP